MGDERPPRFASATGSPGGSPTVAAMTTPTVGAVADAKYVMLTTFRKDGTAVPAPIWAVRDGDALVVWTETESWKVKRLRRNSKVLVQKCDALGRKTVGPEVVGVGRILDAEGSERARGLIGRKYGLSGKALVWGSKLRRGASGTVGIEIVDA